MLAAAGELALICSEQGTQGFGLSSSAAAEACPFANALPWAACCGCPPLSMLFKSTCAPAQQHVRSHRGTTSLNTMTNPPSNCHKLLVNTRMIAFCSQCLASEPALNTLLGCTLTLMAMMFCAAILSRAL